MKKIFLILSVFLILSQSVAYSDTNDAYSFFKGKLDAVISVLQTQNLDNQVKKDTVIQIIMPVFDLPLMAKLSMGKKFWPGLSKDQKNKFTNVFTKRLQKLYIEKIIRYTDVKVVYKPPITKKKNKIFIPTHLISNGNTYSMLYKLYKSKYGWKIYDVEIEDVSILRSFRSQINQVLSTGSFQDLLQKLEKPADNK